jgi:single-strand DNA-binding protein
MFQRVSLIGNVGREPEMRYTPDGTPVASFSIATNTKISKAGKPECPNGWKESYNGKNWELTTWWRITCWRGLAETVNQYLEKGRQVFVEGEMAGESVNGTMNPRVWTGKDGVARASFEITARNVRFIGGRSDAAPGGPPVGEPPPDGFEEDALPF